MEEIQGDYNIESLTPEREGLGDRIHQTACRRVLRLLSRKAQHIERRVAPDGKFAIAREIDYSPSGSTTDIQHALARERSDKALVGICHHGLLIHVPRTHEADGIVLRDVIVGVGSHTVVDNFQIARRGDFVHRISIAFSQD
jgi:hypothetical protein